ncbi:MAG TPA: DUF3558 domain-containing protein [Amycolatopsis sp.]|jgi:hypothetical protein
MRIRFVYQFALVGAAATLLAGCGGSAPRQPSPAPSSSPGAEPMLAPKVAQPLTNTAAYEADPCSALPISEIEKVGGKVKGTSIAESIVGKSCQWTFDGSTGNVSGGFYSGNKLGLNSLYLENRDGHLSLFQPHAPVEGYPAVVYGAGDEGKGSCALAVGVRDDLTYTVNTQLRTGNPALADPCKMAEQIAAAEITRLKAAS